MTVVETHGIKCSRIGGLDVGRKQRVSGGCRLYLFGNLSHATQCLVVGSKRYCVERKGFTVQSWTERVLKSNEYSPIIDGGTAH